MIYWHQRHFFHFHAQCFLVGIYSTGFDVFLIFLYGSIYVLQEMRKSFPVIYLKTRHYYAHVLLEERYMITPCMILNHNLDLLLLLHCPTFCDPFDVIHSNVSSFLNLISRQYYGSYVPHVETACFVTEAWSGIKFY